MSIVQDCVRFSSNDYEKKSFTLEIPDWRVVFVNIFLPRFLVVLWLTGENFLSISFFDIFSSSSPPPQTTFLLCTRSLWSLVCFRIHIKMYCPLILNQGAPDRQWTSRNYYVKISVNREIRIHTWGIVECLLRVCGFYLQTLYGGAWNWKFDSHANSRFQILFG